MSNDINGMNFNNEDVGFDYEPSECFWKIDGPIGRKDFIWMQIGIILISLPAIILGIMGLAAVLFPIILITILIDIWLSIAAFSKRFYDLFGSLKVAVLTTIGLLLLNLLLPVISVIMLIVGATIPGKLIKPKKVI